MPDESLSVDGLTSPEEPKTPSPQKNFSADGLAPSVKRWENIILITGSMLYIVYLFWAFFLVSVLPSPSSALKPLLLMGLLSAAVAALIFLALGGVLLMHIAQSHVAIEARKRALIRIVIFVIPGLIVSGVMPFLISQVPPFGIDIVAPASNADWVAPVPMTFSVKTAVNTLQQNGFKAIDFKWDINGDRKVDQETVIPTLTATYDKEGVYTISVSMTEKWITPLRMHRQHSPTIKREHIR